MCRPVELTGQRLLPLGIDGALAVVAWTSKWQCLCLSTALAWGVPKLPVRGDVLHTVRPIRNMAALASKNDASMRLSVRISKPPRATRGDLRPGSQGHGEESVNQL